MNLFYIISATVGFVAMPTPAWQQPGQAAPADVQVNKKVNSLGRCGRESDKNQRDRVYIYTPRSHKGDLVGNHGGCHVPLTFVAMNSHRQSARGGPRNLGDAGGVGTSLRIIHDLDCRKAEGMRHAAATDRCSVASRYTYICRDGGHCRL